MTHDARGSLQDGRFLLLETLGRGGMGNVYRAFDRAAERVVALKVTTEAGSAGPSHPLCAEYDVWSRLTHPNIVRAFELCWSHGGPIAEGVPYLVLECIDGVPAHRRGGWIERGGAPLLAAARQLLGALAHLHREGFIHRDLKPHNVLAHDGDRGPVVRLTDFGCAVRAGVARPPGTLSGSIAYASPEAVRGLPLDARSDLYALGILVDRLARGRLAAPPGGAEAVLRWHVDGPPLEPAPDLSPRLARFVRRMTARDPAARPTSAEEALGLLDARPSPVRAADASSRGEIARLRLGLDRARGGQTVVLRLPSSPARRRSLLREASVWCQVRGVRYHDVGPAARPGEALAAVALRLVLDAPEEPRELVARYGLTSSVGLAAVGPAVVLEPDATGCASRARGIEARARAVARFVRSRARRSPLVLALDPEALLDPLVEAVCRLLARAEPADAGGLLLLVPTLRGGRPLAPRARSSERVRLAG
jgi:hypothetical protein